MEHVDKKADIVASLIRHFSAIVADLRMLQQDLKALEKPDAPQSK